MFNAHDWSNDAVAPEGKKDAMCPATQWCAWLGCIFGVVGAAILSLHLPWSGWGFVSFLASNVCWFVHAWKSGLCALMVMQLAYSATALLGIWNWMI